MELYFAFLFISSPVLQALKDQVIKECVVGPRHVAFLLEASSDDNGNVFI